MKTSSLQYTSAIHRLAAKTENSLQNNTMSRLKKARAQVDLVSVTARPKQAAPAVVASTSPQAGLETTRNVMQQGNSLTVSSDATVFNNVAIANKEEVPVGGTQGRYEGQVTVTIDTDQLPEGFTAALSSRTVDSSSAYDSKIEVYIALTDTTTNAITKIKVGTLAANTGEWLASYRKFNPYPISEVVNPFLHSIVPTVDDLRAHGASQLKGVLDWIASEDFQQQSQKRPAPDPIFRQGIAPIGGDLATPYSAFRSNDKLEQFFVGLDIDREIIYSQMPTSKLSIPVTIQQHDRRQFEKFSILA